MRYFVLLFLLIASFDAMAAGGIRVELEATTLYEKTVHGMEINVWGVDEEVDFSPLWQQFELIDETVGEMYRVMEGRAQRVRIWNLNVRPKGLGDFTLPVIRAESVHSEASTYRVVARPQSQWQPEEGALTSYWRLEDPQPYVQQGILLTLVIEHRYPLTHLQVDWPQFDGLRVIERGAPRYLIKDGRRSVERSWFVIGERVGQYSQPSVSISAQLSRSRLESAEAFAQTPILTIPIRPLPASYLADWALVAENIELQEQWSDPPSQMLVGQQRLRTITVRAKGVLADQIPDIELPPSRGVSIEPMRPHQRITRWQNNIPVSEASFRYLITAKSPIPVFFDNVRLPWFSTIEDKPKQTLVYALRADIANADSQTLIEKAEVTKKLDPPFTVYGAFSAVLVLTGIALFRGQPLRIRRLLATLYLWFGALGSARYGYRALHHWCGVWQQPLKVLNEPDCPGRDWYSDFSRANFQLQSMRRRKRFIAALAMDRWAVKNFNV